MRSALATLQATAVFHTAATRSSAFTSGSCGCGSQWVPEEDEQVDVSLGDSGADLLVAAHGTAEEPGHGQTELVLEQRPGRTRGLEAVGVGATYPNEALAHLEVEAFSATWHSVSNHVIDFSSDTEATGRCVVYAWHRLASNGQAVIVYSPYHDRYTLVDGAWKFARRELRAADHDGWHLVDLIPIGRSVGGPAPRAADPLPS